MPIYRYLLEDYYFSDTAVKIKLKIFMYLETIKKEVIHIRRFLGCGGNLKAKKKQT